MKTEEKPRDMKEMTMIEHLMELKDRLKVILITVGVLTLVMMVFPAEFNLNLEKIMYAYKPLVSVILDIIKAQLMPEGMRLIGLTITSPLELYFIASLAFGVMFSAPVIAYEIYKYVDPALYPHERRMIYPFIAAFMLLFIGGCLFGYFIIAPFTFKAMLIFFNLTGAEAFVHILDFYNTVFIVVVATGAVFTAPIILILLVKVGLISTKAITNNRKYIYGAAYIVAAIITPDGGMFTNVLLLLVFVALIEGAVLIAKRYEKEREKREAMELLEEEESKPIPGVDVCRFCGEPLHGQMFCPACGRAQR